MSLLQTVLAAAGAGSLTLQPEQVQVLSALQLCSSAAPPAAAQDSVSESVDFVDQSPDSVPSGLTAASSESLCLFSSVLVETSTPEHPVRSNRRLVFWTGPFPRILCRPLHWGPQLFPLLSGLSLPGQFPWELASSQSCRANVVGPPSCGVFQLRTIPPHAPVLGFVHASVLSDTFPALFRFGHLPSPPPCPAAAVPEQLSASEESLPLPVVCSTAFSGSVGSRPAVRCSVGSVEPGAEGVEERERECQKQVWARLEAERIELSAQQL